MKSEGSIGRMLPRLAVMVVLAAAVAFAQDKPLPLVTVTRTDGSTLRGRLTATDPKSVTVTPIAKPRTRDNPEQPGEAVQVAWMQIKSLSNGLTRQRVIEQWKKAHPDEACETCRATGKSTCQTCKGTGRDPAAAKDCPTCKGVQTAACNAPRCENGIIPCPKPCLKPTDAGWFKKADGKMWRRFPGGLEVSDGHLGQVVEAGGPVTCPTCKGEMKVKCPKCGGDAAAACPQCAKSAKANPCPACQQGLVACKTCAGMGLKPDVLGIDAPPATAPAE